MCFLILCHQHGLLGPFEPIKGFVDLQSVPGITTLDDEGHRKLQLTCTADPVKTDTGCMGDASVVSGLVRKANDLGCTSNDVVVASAKATGVSVNGVSLTPVACPDGTLSCFSCVEGTMLDVSLTVDFLTSSQERRSDIGLWLGQNSTGDAISGKCTHVVFPSPLLNELDTTQDQCGDIGNQETKSVSIPETVKIQCGSVGGATTDVPSVIVPYCIGWKIPGADKVCPTSFTATGSFNQCELGTTPGTKSKCKCGTTQLNILIQRCTYSASCKTLSNADVEGCNATTNNGLPPLKQFSDVFNITKTNCGGNETYSSSNWTFTGSLCSRTTPLRGTRTYTVTPPANAINPVPLTCSESVIIKDTTAPVITCPAASGTFNCETIATRPNLTATDTCGSATVTYKGCCFTGSAGTNLKHERTWSAVDQCGNNATNCVVVNDVTQCVRL
jgi:hypothetical protein